ncbi:hypothetical protein MINS_06330 [Mycolicibacterium insubricum]|nr:hypothetical protein MINS_06330 [Mycolicibacterium insubricum]
MVPAGAQRIRRGLRTEGERRGAQADAQCGMDADVGGLEHGNLFSSDALGRRDGGVGSAQPGNARARDDSAIRIDCDGRLGERPNRFVTVSFSSCDDKAVPVS